jgi:hypothetical protein
MTFVNGEGQKTRFAKWVVSPNWDCSSASEREDEILPNLSRASGEFLSGRYTVLAFRV